MLFNLSSATVHRFWSKTTVEMLKVHDLSVLGVVCALIYYFHFISYITCFSSLLYLLCSLFSYVELLLPVTVIIVMQYYFFVITVTFVACCS